MIWLLSSHPRNAILNPSAESPLWLFWYWCSNGWRLICTLTTETAMGHSERPTWPIEFWLPIWLTPDPDPTGAAIAVFFHISLLETHSDTGRGDTTAGDGRDEEHCAAYERAKEESFRCFLRQHGTVCVETSSGERQGVRQHEIRVQVQSSPFQRHQRCRAKGACTLWLSNM